MRTRCKFAMHANGMWVRVIFPSGDVMQSTYVRVQRSSETAFQRELLELADVAVDRSRVVESYVRRWAKTA